MGLELIKGYLSFVNTGCSYSAVKVLAPTCVAAENFEMQLGAGACSHKLLEHWSVPSRKAACEEHGGRPATRSERNEFAFVVEHATSGWIQHMRVRMWAECLEHPFRGTECEITIAVELTKGPFDRTAKVRVHQNSEIKPIIEAGN